MQVHHAGDILTVTVTTDPIFHGMDLSRHILDELKPFETRVVLDLHLIDLLHSPGLAQVVTLYISLGRRGVTLALANLNERNRRLLAVTQLDQLFKVV